MHVVGELVVRAASAGGRRGNASGGIVAVGEIRQLFGVFLPPRDSILVDTTGFLGSPDPGQKSKIPPPRTACGGLFGFGIVLFLPGFFFARDGEPALGSRRGSSIRGIQRNAVVASFGRGFKPESRHCELIYYYD
jgi:hypothetical protein